MSQLVEYLLVKNGWFYNLDLHEERMNSAMAKVYGNTEFVELEDIAHTCKDSLRGKIVYFGSCLTLNIDKRRINTFLKQTKALAVFGYKESIDFTTSTALDLMIMEVLQRNKDMRKVEEEIKKNFSQLTRNLKFRMVY